MALKRVSGLWLKDGRNGKFMSGETDTDIPAGTRLFIFKNTKKVDGDKQPDYSLNVAPPDPGSDRGSQRSSSGPSRGNGSQRQDQFSGPAQPPPPPPDESTIPF